MEFVCRQWQLARSAKSQHKDLLAFDAKRNSIRSAVASLEEHLAKLEIYFFVFRSTATNIRIRFEIAKSFVESLFPIGGARW